MKRIKINLSGNILLLKHINASTAIKNLLTDQGHPVLEQIYIQTRYPLLLNLKTNS